MILQVEGQREMGRRRKHGEGLRVQGQQKGSARMSLGKACLTPQHVLVSIYSYKGSSFKYNLTEDFRMDCKICPANLNCTFQTPWERSRNADNTKLAMLSVTKDMYAFKTSWKNIIHFLFQYDRIRTLTSMLRSYYSVKSNQYKTF